MFKINKVNLKFALDLTSKALAQRQQEEIIYRSVRITTFESEKKHYVMFSSNGGYNAVKTTGYEVIDFKEHIDVLVECQKLLLVIDKSTVDEVKFEKLDEENIRVTANGSNKIRCMPGEAMAEFAVYNPEECLGEMNVKAFVDICKTVTPFATDDIHKAPLIGLCIDKNNVYATDEFKCMTLLNVGLDIDKQLNFNSIALEMIKMFDSETQVQFFLGRMENAADFSHLLLIVEGIEMYILKYQSGYPSATLDTVNNLCKDNKNKFKIGRTTALKMIDRISIFTDENDLLSITPISNKSVVFEASNKKTNEVGKEELESIVVVDSKMMNVPINTSLVNFKVMLENLPVEEVEIAYSEATRFISVIGDKFVSWLTTKKVE